MLINLEQCQILLAEGVIEKIHALFRQYKCSDIKIYLPVVSNQNGKINFYVKDDNGDMDYYTASCLSNDLKNLINYEHIHLSFDSLIEPDFKPIIFRDIIEFNRPNIENLFSALKGFNIKIQETSGKSYVIIEFGSQVSKTKLNELVEVYSDATQRELQHEIVPRQFSPTKTY